MKKLAALLLLTVLTLVCTAAMAYPSLEEIGEYALVNNANPQDRLHLRTGPGAGYGSLGKYYNGTVCEILEGSAQDMWVKVRIYPTDIGGWMKTDYLAFGQERDQVTGAWPTAWVSDGAGAKLYTRDKTASDVVATLPNGTQVTVLGISGSTWSHVQCENLTGYVLTRQLRQEQPPVTGGQTGSAYVKNPNPWERLNLRARPSLDSDILGRYYDNTRVTVMASTADGWSYVRVGGRVGYMMSQYLTFSAPQTAPAGQTAYVTNPRAAQRLNLRTGPGTQYASLGLFCTGTPVTVLSRSGGWAKVQVGAQTGYMDEAYLSGTYVQPYYRYYSVLNTLPTQRLNLRQEPSTRSASLGKYYDGTRVTVMGYLAGDEWAYVQVGAKTGYMMLDFLQ